MNVRSAAYVPDPDEVVSFIAPFPIGREDTKRLARLVRELGFEDRSRDVLHPAGGRVLQVRLWVSYAVQAAIHAADTEDGEPVVVYAAARRALRACVDPDFRKAFWSAYQLGGLDAGGAYLLANAPARRVNRTAKDTRDALDAAWRLGGEGACDPIVDALNAIPAGGSAKINGCTVRRGKPYGNEYRYWIESPRMGREQALPGEPRRLLRPLREAALLATMGAERPRSKPRR